MRQQPGGGSKGKHPTLLCGLKVSCILVCRLAYDLVSSLASRVSTWLRVGRPACAPSFVVLSAAYEYLLKQRYTTFKASNCLAGSSGLAYSHTLEEISLCLE